LIPILEDSKTKSNKILYFFTGWLKMPV
jgi:hypothetical protein